MKPDSGLLSNPFRILEATYTSTVNEITDLLEDAEFDEFFEQEVLLRAQQALVTPRERIFAELGWLPELSQQQVDKVVANLEKGDVDQILSGIDHYPELAQANILSFLSDKSDAVDLVASRLCSCWDDIDTSDIANFLNDMRGRSGFPTVTEDQVEETLAALVAEHATTVSKGIWSSKESDWLMNWITESELERNPDNVFLKELVREYDKGSETKLNAIIEAMDESAENARDYPENAAEYVQTLDNLLVKWDDINQPVQLYEQHHGLEEARSKEVYRRLRDLCLELANDHGQHKEALHLSEALLRTFPELESVAEELRKDVSDLEELIEQEDVMRHLEPLVDACESAKGTSTETLAKHFREHGFSQRGIMIGRKIADTFRVARSGLGDHDAPFLVMRSLALHLNNEANSPEAAFQLLDALLREEGVSMSSEIRKLLEEERGVLHKNWKMSQLEASSGDIGAMSSILDELMLYADPAEKVEYRTLKEKLDRKNASRKLKWGFFSVLALIIFGSYIYGENKKPSYNYTPSRPPSTEYTSKPTPRPVQPAKPARAPTSEVKIETKPPVGKGHLLSRNQIRYCVFEEKRMENLRGFLTNNHEATQTEIRRFNAIVNDWNSRCSSYKYRGNDLSVVESEAEAQSFKFMTEAIKEMGRW
jgi:hypothetical protein